MPGMLTSDNPKPRRTFRCPSIPFYLKVVLLACASTAASTLFRESSLREEVSSGINSDSVRSINNTGTEAFFSMQRHLLQDSIQLNNEPVIVANPIPDQFVQIGERYIYDVSKVFAGDYLSIQASGLPSWLNLEYKKLSAYPAGNGAAQRVVVSGNTVFVANGKAGVQILDVSNLRFPQLLSTYSFGNSLALDVAISGNILFVANHNAGVQILNVSNLKSPQLLSTYPVGSGSSYGVAVWDNTLFVANYNAGLLILNVSNLRPPQFLSIYPAGNGLTFGVTVSRNIVFMANYNAGLLILNVSNLSYPQLLSSYPGAGTFKVAVSGNTVFIPNYNAFLILNVTDLKNPKLLSTIYPANSGRAYGVAVLDKILFGANYNGGLLILNVSNLNKPQVLGFYSTTNGYANGVVVSDNRVFVAYDVGGLHIPDLSSARLIGIPLATEVKVGQKWMIDVVAQNLDTSMICTFQLTAGYLPQLVQNTLTDKSILPGEPFLISIKSQQLFSAPAASFLRFSLHQVGNKVLPAWLALEVYPTSLSTYPVEQTGSVGNVVVLGNTVFPASDKGLFILDVSDLKSPQLLSKYSKSGGLTRGVSILNNTAFVANWNAGISILNVSDPRYPKLLSDYYLPSVNYAWGIAISSSGNTLFVTNHNSNFNGSLQILDVSNCTSPRLIYTYLTSSKYVWGVAVAGNTVFIASDYKGVIILNVSNPRSPQLLNNYLINGNSGYAYDVAISNNILFVAGYYAGLLVLNVSNPKNPQLLSTYPAGSGLSCGVAVLGNTVFVANWNPGLLILDVSNLTQPQLVGTYPAGNGFSRGVAVSGNTVFVANGNGGLQILDIRNWELKISATPTVTDVGNYYLTLIATDEIGASISIPFTIRVEGAPQVKSPIAQQYAEIGQLFSFNIPSDTFQVIAQDNHGGSATTFFNLNVNGTSTLGLLIKVATPILSVLGLFRKRAPILNRFCYKRRQKDPKSLEAGQHFSLTLSTLRSSVRSVEVKTRHIPPKGCVRLINCQRFFKPPIHYIQLPYDALPDGLALPKWMEYEKSTNTLEGIVPANVGYRELIVFVKNRNGIVQEHFTLKIEGAALDQDEEENTRQKADHAVELTSQNEGYMKLPG